MDVYKTNENISKITTIYTYFSFRSANGPNALPRVACDSVFNESLVNATPAIQTKATLETALKRPEHVHGDNNHSSHIDASHIHVNPPEVNSILTMDKTVFTEWPQNRNQSHDHGMGIKSIFLGSLCIGSLIGGILADNFKRKNVIIGFACLLSLSGLLTWIAWNIESFTCLWFFMGTGILGTYVVTYIQIVENMTNKYRVAGALALFGSSWNIARMAASLLAWATRDWSMIFFILSLWSCFMLIVKYMCCGKEAYQILSTVCHFH